VRVRRVLRTLAGPAAFATGAVVGARLEPGYSHADEPMSALAAKGTRSARVMVPAFLGLAVGTLGAARALRGTRVAPRPVPALITLAGLTTAGAGLARNSDRSCPTRWLGDEGATRSDDLHAWFSAATFALWITIPLVAARRATDASAVYRAWSRRLGGATLVALLVNGRLARSESQRWSGATQRLMVACALSWYPLAGATAG
jgi:hypothetical protein